jgi:hypothetical protein
MLKTPRNPSSLQLQKNHYRKTQSKFSLYIKLKIHPKDDAQNQVMGIEINISARQRQWLDSSPRIYANSMLKFHQSDSHSFPTTTHPLAIARPTATLIHGSISRAGCRQHRTRPTGPWWQCLRATPSPGCPARRNSRSRKRRSSTRNSLATLSGSTRLVS